LFLTEKVLLKILKKFLKEYMVFPTLLISSDIIIICFGTPSNIVTTII